MTRWSVACTLQCKVRENLRFWRTLQCKVHATLRLVMLTIQAGMQLGGVPVGVPVTPSCVLVGKFGKNKFIPWHANLGAIAGKAHTVLDHGDMCLRPIMQADNRPGDDLCEYMKDSDTPLILLCTSNVEAKELYEQGADYVVQQDFLVAAAKKLHAMLAVQWRASITDSNRFRDMQHIHQKELEEEERVALSLFQKSERATEVRAGSLLSAEEDEPHGSLI